jgi:hypothetical protein
MSGGYALAAEVSRPEGGRPSSRLGCVRDAPPVHPASSRQPRQAGLMAPLLVLLGGWLLLRTAGRVGVEQLSSWRSAGRGAAAGMFMFTGVTHFSPMKHDYAAMIPEPLPRDLRLIHLTGLLQIAGAVGLLIPPLRRVAGSASPPNSSPCSPQLRTPPARASREPAAARANGRSRAARAEAVEAAIDSVAERRGWVQLGVQTAARSRSLMRRVAPM